MGEKLFLLNHEPHEIHERWHRVGRFEMCEGPPSDPRLRRALHACGIQGCAAAESPPKASLVGASPLPTIGRLSLGQDLSTASRLAHYASRNSAVRPWASRALWSKLACRTETCTAHQAGVCLTDRRVSVGVRRWRNWKQTPPTATALSWVSCGSWLENNPFHHRLWKRTEVNQQSQTQKPLLFLGA